MTHTAYFVNVQQARQALEHAWNQYIKPMTMAGHRVTGTFKPETRKDSHNRHFHKLIGCVSEQIGGDLADKDDAKRILVSAFRIDTINDADLSEEWRKFGDFRVGRGLRGEVVMLGMQTREFSSKLGGAFCQWLEAFCVEHNVKVPPPKWMLEEAGFQQVSA